MIDFYEETKKGLILQVKLNPKAKQTGIIGVSLLDEQHSCLKIKVAVPPENNKANAALIDLLSAEMGIAKTNFEIIAGQTSRHKKILIRGELTFLVSKVKVLGTCR